MPVIIQANYPLRLSSSLSSLFKTYYNSFVCSCHGRPYTEVQNQTPFKKRAQVRPDRLCVSSIKQYRWYIISVTCTNQPKTKTIIYRYWVSFLPFSHASFRSTTSFTCRKCLFGNWLAGRGLLCFRFIAIVKQILS